MPPRISSALLDLYKPITLRESLYLRTRWRLCPYEKVESYIPNSGKILDFGCGYGILSNFLALNQSDRDVLGMDLNRKRIDVAKRSIKGRKNISFRCIPFGGLKLSTFDAVVMTDVLHHIDENEINSILRSVWQCLRPGGKLVILDVDRRPILKFLITYLIDRMLNPNTGLYYRSVESMQHFIAQFPFRIERMVPSHKGLPLSDIIYVCSKESLP